MLSLEDAFIFLVALFGKEWRDTHSCTACAFHDSDRVPAARSNVGIGWQLEAPGTCLCVHATRAALLRQLVVCMYVRISVAPSLHAHPQGSLTHDDDDDDDDDCMRAQWTEEGTAQSVLLALDSDGSCR